MVVLHLSCKLVGVRRHDAVVPLCRGNQSRRVSGSGLGVMERRVTQQVSEHLLTFFRRSVVIGPARTGGKGVVTQHVQNAHTWQCHLEKVRSLSRYCADQQTTIGSTTDSQFLLAGVALSNQVLGRRDKVIKDVLLLRFGASDVPRFTVFTAATNIGHGINAAHLKPRCNGATETRSDTDIKAAVTVKNGRGTAVEYGVLGVRNDHGYAGTVLGCVEHLLGLIVVAVKGGL